MRFRVVPSFGRSPGVVVVAVLALAGVGVLSPVSALAAAPAWAPIAVSGPTDLPPVQSEVQRLGIDAEGGTFTLTVHHVAARGTGDTKGAFSTISNVVTSSGAFAVGQGIEGRGIPAGATITAVGSGTLTISALMEIGQAGPGASLIATDAASETTSPLAFDADASEVEAALNALGLVHTGGGSVSVSGGPGGKNSDHPYFISFDGGPLADTDAPQLSVNGAALTAAGAPSAVVSTTVPGGRGTGKIAIYAQNVGGLSTSGATITASVTLPAGVTTAGTPEIGFPVQWTCSPGAGQQTFTCTSTQIIAPGSVAQTITAPVVTTESTSALKTVEVSISGGGAGTASYRMPLTVSPDVAEAGIQAFTAGAYNENGVLDTRAGGHPYSGSAGIFVNTYRNSHGNVVPVGEFKDIEVDLPPGFLGNPTATPQCPEANLAEAGAVNQYCPTDSIIGRAGPILTSFGNEVSDNPVYNVEAPFGYPGKFFFDVLEVPIDAVGSLRSDGDYGITVSSLSTAQIATVFGSFFTFWGAPANHSHDRQRCNGNSCHSTPVESDAPETAFLTNATNCAEEAMAPAVVNLRVTTWQSPLVVHTGSVPVPPITECDKLHFESDFTFQPAETKADSPTAFTTDLMVPSEGLTNPAKLTTPEQKRVVVHLPAGVVLNPSAAGGLGACSEAQIGLKGTNFTMPNPIRFDKNPNQCPDSSKIGTLEIKTALLAEALHGALYLASQGENPFGALFAVYLVIEDPRHGVFIKLSGDTEPDPQTGQVTVTFDDLPQLPFESLKLNLKGTSRSPFATPNTCGTYTTTSVNTPWSAPESGPPFETENSFNINSGPNGSACASTPGQRPFNPALSAGTVNTSAGAFTPFSLKLTRNDGEQELSSIDVSAPPGFVGVLTGVPFCPEAAIKAAEANTGTTEQQNPSCPASSQIGTLTAGVGVGSTPFYASGKAYFAGPYKGDPFSIVFVTPAVAGPFDLGDVVVRAAIHVNPETAQISVKTDAIPQILDGVPLQVRSIEANINRPNFGLNPTSCERFAVATTVYGASGAVSSPSEPFQVGGCAGLAFKPQFAVSTSGKTSRADGASLAVKLTYPSGAGEANIARVKVELPKQLPSRLTTLQKACTAATFNANPAGCPAESIIGMAKAVTPVLPVPLVGPAYFVSHGGEAFPSLIIVLQGYGVTVDLVGTTFISKAGITSSTFKTVPDVPVGSFELTLPEGKYSALAANGNLCTSKLVMPTEFVGQNGAVLHQSTKIAVTGCPQVKKATLTRAQKLKAALKVCKKDKGKKQRTKCEKAARKKFGPIKKKKQTTTKKKK